MAEPWAESLVVVDIKSSGWDELFRQVTRHVDANPSPSDPPLCNIIHGLKKQDCTSALIQSPYLDLDTLWDYLHDYGRFWREGGKHCARIHFFAGPTIRQQDLLDDLACYAGKGSQGARYLGYMIIRPTGNECVGRTIIASPFDDIDADIHVRASYPTSLCGFELRVTGAPFMQQDRSSHVCAGAALWMLCYDLHRRYGTPRFFPRQVTEIATTQLTHGRAINEGLTPTEMARMLGHLDCAVDTFGMNLLAEPDKRASRLRSFANVVYSYLHSNLPVLVGYWYPNEAVGHVVMAVGHDLQYNMQTPAAGFDGQIGPTFVSDFVSCFFVNDDQRGAYQPLQIWSPGKSAGRAVGVKSAPPVLEEAESVFCMPGITESARLYAWQARDVVLDELEFVFGKPGLATRIEQLLGDTRLRLYFQRSIRFRAQLHDQETGRHPLPKEHRRAYACMRLPRFLYVCDFCVPCTDPQRRFYARGEMLIDATCPPYSPGKSVLAVRVGADLYLSSEKGLDHHVHAATYAQDPFAPTNLASYP